MKINYIKIRGSIGIKKGQGVDEIEFDLRNKTGLVAFSGPNGAGKSTVLELMSPYRTFASRKGALRHHFFLRDSFIETHFEYNNRSYQTIRKIDSGSDRSEAFIIVDGESVVNGKLKEYDNYILDLFGSETLFYSSVFCAQGSDSMASMTPGKIKDLFVEFLQIEKLEEYRKTAKSGVEYYQKELDKLSGQIEACNDELESYHNVEKEIENRQAHIDVKDNIISDTDADIKESEYIINLLEKKKESQKVNKLRIAEIQTELRTLILKRSEIKSRVEEHAELFESEKNKINAEMEMNDSFLDNKDKIFSASSKIDWLDEKEKYMSICYECAIDEQNIIDIKIKDIDKQKEAEEKRIVDLEDDIVLDGLKTTSNALKSKLEMLAAEKKKLTNDLASSKQNFELMKVESDVSECRAKIAMAIDPDCTSTICPAIVMIKDAKANLSDLEKKEKDIRNKSEKNISILKQLIEFNCVSHTDTAMKLDICVVNLDSYRAIITNGIEFIRAELDDIEKKRKLMLSEYLYLDECKSFYRDEIKNIRSIKQNLEDLSSKKPEIQIAEEKAKLLDRELHTIIRNHKKNTDLLSIQFDETTEEIRSKEDEIVLIEKNIDEHIVKSMADHGKTLSALKSDKKNHIKELDILKSDIAVLQNNLEKRDKLAKLMKEKNAYKKDLGKELSEWNYLTIACSKTGLQALEIDGATPLIVVEANTLLEKSFGLSSQIRIVTQDPESGREVFWIKVIREDGSEDDFSNLSGGQKVWIAKALSLGMTLVSKRKSDRNFMTLFADEEDGALDSEKALEFVRLYRSMMATGDFETCFFISHNPDVVAMADQKIEF